MLEDRMQPPRMTVLGSMSEPLLAARHCQPQCFSHKSLEAPPGWR